MERQNTYLWLQGRYFYDALLCTAPVLKAFTKKGVKPSPYHEEPYPLSHDVKEEQAEKKAKSVYNKGLAKMEAFMGTFNKKFNEKNGGS